MFEIPIGLRLWSRIAADMDCLYRGALKTYIEPSYLITTCCDWIAPVFGSRFGLMNT
jgi:hypothetical protein